jgi:WD40 repeat protein
VDAVTAIGECCMPRRMWLGKAGLGCSLRPGHAFERTSASGHQAKNTDGTRIVTASDDKTARIWDAHFATMSTNSLLVETCARRLAGFSKLSRDDMRLLGYEDATPEIDVCEGIR